MSQNKKGTHKKSWKVKSIDSDEMELMPIFKVNKDYKANSGIISDREVECQFIEITLGGKTYKFNYLDLYMFMYFTSNEELRLNLAQRYERKIYNIPYDVEFKLTPEEKSIGKAKRRITLSVDEIAMAMARNEHLKYFDVKTGKLNLPER